MASILKVTAKWDGFNGGPGYSNFFFKPQGFIESGDVEAAAAANAVSSFFGSILSVFPNPLKITLQSDVPVIDETNGEMTHIANGGGWSAQQGTGGTAAYSGPSGAVVTWRTAGVRNSRRVRGRTFLVPLAGGIYDVDGSLAGGPLSTIRTAASALVAAGGSSVDPVVWSRPSAPGASDGIAHIMNAATVNDSVAILRSRRA
jgi:hypothetical protein